MIKSLEKIYDELKDSLGSDNLMFEYFNPDESEIQGLDVDEILNRMLSKVKVTYLPSQKIFLGTEHGSQIENAISAMQKIKLSLKTDLNKL
ncbi:MAG: hypothetical protein NXH86_16215 [Flavobacteriaceae bacterium]|uniref:hypothetical protein n=1 Tax=Flagellimonas sp. SN16 TaxID=3415142 RepID=UPI003C50881C|nr:hypothetical protein [Flavobacteriaceae bacterium]